MTLPLLPLVSDLLLICGALALAGYCWHLNRLLRASPTAVPAPVVPEVPSSEIEALEARLRDACEAARLRTAELSGGCARAEEGMARLEMLVAAAEDVADPVPETSSDAVVAFRATRGGRS